MFRFRFVVLSDGVVWTEREGFVCRRVAHVFFVSS